MLFRSLNCRWRVLFRKDHLNPKNPAVCQRGAGLWMVELVSEQKRHSQYISLSYSIYSAFSFSWTKSYASSANEHESFHLGRISAVHATKNKDAKGLYTGLCRMIEGADIMNYCYRCRNLRTCGLLQYFEFSKVIDILRVHWQFICN